MLVSFRSRLHSDTMPSMMARPPRATAAFAPTLPAALPSTRLSATHSAFCARAPPSRRSTACHNAARLRARVVPCASAKPAKQQDTQWNRVTVVDSRAICEDHLLLTLNVGITFETGSLCDAYRVPGMFVQLRPTDADARGVKPGFFAISSPPTITGAFEFLIKRADSTGWLEALKPGDALESSPVMGKGFPFAALKPAPQHVLLFATGSGIAPIRAAIESVINGVEPRRRASVTLLYGAQTPQRMAYTDRFDEWRANNVDVVPVISRPKDASEPWEGRVGYLQAVLPEIEVKDPANTAALLCGVKPMTEEVKAMLLDMGLSEQNILFNF